MNREIKFRAYWKELNEMIHFDFDKGEFTWAPDERIGMFIPAQEGKLYMGEPVIMQFTGLKDKNGKEIYEGDILELSAPLELTGRKPKQKTPVAKQRVIFHEGSFRLTAGLSKPKYRLNSLAIRYCGLEVIGDIYKNPELI